MTNKKLADSLREIADFYANNPDAPQPYLAYDLLLRLRHWPSKRFTMPDKDA